MSKGKNKSVWNQWNDGECVCIPGSSFWSQTLCPEGPLRVFLFWVQSIWPLVVREAWGGSLHLLRRLVVRLLRTRDCHWCCSEMKKLRFSGLSDGTELQSTASRFSIWLTQQAELWPMFLRFALWGCRALRVPAWSPAHAHWGLGPGYSLLWRGCGRCRNRLGLSSLGSAFKMWGQFEGVAVKKKHLSLDSLGGLG